MSLSTYSGLTTKIRAMKSRLLTQSDFREIVELPDVPAVISYLRQKPGYEQFFSSLAAEDLHRGKVEPLLQQSLYWNFTKLYRFANGRQREFLRLYSIQFEVRLLKHCLTAILTDSPVPEEETIVFREFIDRHSKLDYQQLLAATTIDELQVCLAKTRYKDVFAHLKNSSKPGLYDYELALDIFYFRSLWVGKDKLKGREESRILTEILGTKIDVLNLLWVCRCKKYYNLSAMETASMLIPVTYRLNQAFLMEMCEAVDTNTLQLYLDKSRYGRRFPNLKLDTLEECYEDVMYKTLNTLLKKDPYSVCSVYTYLHRKEREIRKLTLAMECVRYRIPPEDAMMRVARFSEEV